MYNKLILTLTLLLFTLGAAASNEGEKTMKATNLTKQDFINKVMDYKSNPSEWKYKGLPRLYNVRHEIKKEVAYF